MWGCPVEEKENIASSILFADFVASLGPVIVTGDELQVAGPSIYTLSSLSELTPSSTHSGC